MKVTLQVTTVFYFATTTLAANWTLIKEYSGQTFFDGWDFVDTGDLDITNQGDIKFVPQSNQPPMAFVDANQRVIIKADNTSFVPFDQKRSSVEITSKDFYEAGTVWIFDAVHLPYGCSVWPAFWTRGIDWPSQGEIDIVEGINKMTFNQMSIHTYAGCHAASGTDQTGQAGVTDCNATTNSGCTVMETAQNSFGPGFAANGGGVWATQFDASGIFIWFWPRAKVPAAITTASGSIDLSQWGPPSAAYPVSGCDIGTFFGPQQLVIDITLCGVWAGVPSIYLFVEGTGRYLNSVVNNGSSDLNTAYFEINYIKAFGVNASVIVPSPSSSAAGEPTTTSGATHSATPSNRANSPTGDTQSAAVNMLKANVMAAWAISYGGVTALLLGLML